MPAAAGGPAGGARESRQAPDFADAFSGGPDLRVGLAKRDIGSRTDPRTDPVAGKAKRRAIALVFRTRGDTRIARTLADRRASGPVREAEDRAIA